ncbi:heterokaryon incompatibility protein-domain-containing protein [Camillea tinctor]|nr:heterokaryon incompatibility protein-domain-containing protein [Camillea tinctor]
MLCEICRDGLQGIWDPTLTRRLGPVEEILNTQPEDRNMDRIPNFRVGSRRERDEYTMREPEYYVFAHHPDFTSFEQSMARGCAMCNRFRPTPDDAALNPKLKEFGCFSAFAVSFQPPSSEIIMTVFYGDTQGGFAFVPFQDAFNDDLNLKISPSTNGVETWNLINRWQKNCGENHTLCDSRSTIFPTRLLEVGEFGDKGDVIRLVQGSAVPSHERYACLSHSQCTESMKAHLMLSEDSQALLKSGFLVEELSKTIQDTIAVIRRLNIRYVWIDHLCVFQDSVEDREAQALSINQIYKNCYLNIAALGARNDNDGCFFTRNPQDVKATVFDMCVDSQGLPRPYVFDLDRTWGWTLSLRGEPLLHEGWFVQEHLLAPRTLLFGTKQVFWECKEHVSCELHPNGTPNSGPQSKDHASRAAFKCIHGLHFRQVSTDPLRQLVLDWYSIVAYYSSHQSNVPEDKLLPISGIVKEMKKIFSKLGNPSAQCLAGVWKHTFPEGLLWNLRGESKRLLSRSVPSWSWASVDGSINIQSFSSEKAIWFTEALDKKYEVSDPDDGAAIENEVINLRGPLAMAVIADVDKQWGWRPSDRKVDSLENLGETRNKIASPSDYEARFIMRWSVGFDAAQDVTNEVPLLIVRAQPWGEIWHITALALKSTSSNNYQRVGIANLNVPDEESARNLIRNFPYADVTIH